VPPGLTVGRVLCTTTHPTVRRVFHPTTRLTVGSPLTVNSRSESRTSGYGNYTSDSRISNPNAKPNPDPNRNPNTNPKPNPIKREIRLLDV